MKYTILIFSIFMGCTTKEQPSRWTTTDNPDEFKPVELNLTEFSLNDRPIILRKSELLNLYGKPDTIIFGGGFFPEDVRNSGTKSSNTLVEYKRYRYGPVSFAVWGNSAQLQFIDFVDTDIILKHPKATLSNKTTLEEIKNKFPYTYEWRNYPLHRQFGLDPKEIFGFDKEDCIWLDFKNGLDPFHSNIELTFLKGKLIWADFEIVENKYRP